MDAHPAEPRNVRPPGGTMRTLVALLLSIGILAAVPACAAAGGQPTREFLPAPDTIELPDTCAFPVLLTVLVNGEYLLSFPSGRQIISGTSWSARRTRSPGRASSSMRRVPATSARTARSRLRATPCNGAPASTDSGSSRAT